MSLTRIELGPRADVFPPAGVERMDHGLELGECLLELAEQGVLKVRSGSLAVSWRKRPALAAPRRFDGRDDEVGSLVQILRGEPTVGSSISSPWSAAPWTPWCSKPWARHES
jgi:hypothetical protein